MNKIIVILFMTLSFSPNSYSDSVSANNNSGVFVNGENNGTINQNFSNNNIQRALQVSASYSSDNKFIGETRASLGSMLFSNLSGVTTAVIKCPSNLYSDSEHLITPQGNLTLPVFSDKSYGNIYKGKNKISLAFDSFSCECINCEFIKK